MAKEQTKQANNYKADKYQLEVFKKFPSTHYLSKPTNVLNVMAWCTFWRRNMHRFALDYLRIHLHEYQALTLYLMGISNFVCIIASRNTAKSFIVALYAVCKCILYPRTKFRIGSATLKQAKLIVSEKIIDELCEWSPVLRSEIRKWSTSDKEPYVKFNNGSKITVFVANDNARGLRSTDICREEFRQIKKEIEDKVISPFQTPRNPSYILLPYYKNNPTLQEEPTDIYISSSWVDDGNWMWDIVNQASSGMMKGDGSIFLAFDESIVLKHGLKTMNYMKRERKKQDPVSWKTEFLNLKVKDSLSAYFTYSMLMNRQVLRQVFYPKEVLPLIYNGKASNYMPKLENEIRVVSNDIAFVAGEKNDNSAYVCIRGIPETSIYENEDDSIEIKQGYKRKYCYLETNQLGDTTLQAIRIRQLYEDFNADYIVVDARNGGGQIVYTLQKVLYDPERKIEYPPLKCMNDESYSRVCQDSSAKPCIFVINASQSLNSEIAVSFRRNLVEKKIEFLVNNNTAQEEIIPLTGLTAEQRVDLEMPFLQTQLMIHECADLQYEKTQSGNIKVYEKGNNTKDRYTACSYGSYFMDLMEQDWLSENVNVDSENIVKMARKPTILRRHGDYSERRWEV